MPSGCESCQISSYFRANRNWYDEVKEIYQLRQDEWITKIE